MRRCSLVWLVASSLLLPAGYAVAASRPHYGGTLRVALRDAPQSLSPEAPADLFLNVFETLVTLDRRGRPQPLLAVSWEVEPGNQRWRFLLRHGVSFHDGTPLDAMAVAASLRNSAPEWKVLPAGDAVMIESDTPDPYLPAELALSRHCIVHRSGNALSGTGPFKVVQWLPGKHLTLAANDYYWNSRPFFDGIEVELGRSERDQLLALDLGKLDIADVAPESVRRNRSEGRTVETSQPAELIALLFSSDPKSDDEVHARETLAAAVDTIAINDVVLQGGGTPASALLPDWLSGYAFALQAVKTPHVLPSRPIAWTLGYDSADPVSRIIAERVLLNARDAGLALQITGQNRSDVRLVRVPLPSLDPHVALLQLAKNLQLAVPRFGGGSVAEMYVAEKTLLQSHRIIPLLHLRHAVALRSGIHGWSGLPDGTWQLGDVWLPLEKP